MPNGIENSMFQLGKILLLSLISTFGTASIAANAVSNSLAYFEILPGMALGLATVTVISRCVGAGRLSTGRILCETSVKIHLHLYVDYLHRYDALVTIYVENL